MGWIRWLVFGSKEAAVRSAPQTVMNSSVVRLAGSRGYVFEIVGEGRRQDELEAIAGPKCEDGCKIKVDAELRPEPTNPHSPEAVQVLIEGAHVGYIARADSKLIGDGLKALQVPPNRAICRAKIVGGWKREDDEDGEVDEGSFGVKLNLAVPLRRDKS